MIHMRGRQGRRPRPGFRVRMVLALAAAACSGSSDDVASDAAATDTAIVQGVYGTAPPAVGGTPSVVVLHPSETPVEGVTRDTPVIDQLGLDFTPRLLLVAEGERVAFTNSESVGHNVHVRFTDTDSTVLNADTEPGGRIEHSFEEEGGYDVTCDTHAGMRAFIYVTSSPYAVFADQDGHFRMPDVPSGSYTASVWSVDPGLRVQRELEVGDAGTEVNLGR